LGLTKKRVTSGDPNKAQEVTKRNRFLTAYPELSRRRRFDLLKLVPLNWKWDKKKVKNYQQDPRWAQLQVFWANIMGIDYAALNENWALHHIQSPHVFPDLCFCWLNVRLIPRELHEVIHHKKQKLIPQETE